MSETATVTLDVSGLPCPAPLLGAKKLIDDLQPGQTLRLPARSPAQVFHLIEGRVQAQIVDSTFTLAEADTCCAPGYTAVTLRNRTAGVPTAPMRRRSPMSRSTCAAFPVPAPSCRPKGCSTA